MALLRYPVRSATVTRPGAQVAGGNQSTIAVPASPGMRHNSHQRSQGLWPDLHLHVPQMRSAGRRARRRCARERQAPRPKGVTGVRARLGVPNQLAPDRRLPAVSSQEHQRLPKLAAPRTPPRRGAERASTRAAGPNAGRQLLIENRAPRDSPLHDSLAVLCGRAAPIRTRRGFT